MEYYFSEVAWLSCEHGFRSSIAHIMIIVVVDVNLKAQVSPNIRVLVLQCMQQCGQIILEDQRRSTSSFCKSCPFGFIVGVLTVLAILERNQAPGPPYASDQESHDSPWGPPPSTHQGAMLNLPVNHSIIDIPSPNNFSWMRVLLAWFGPLMVVKYLIYVPRRKILHCQDASTSRSAVLSFFNKWRPLFRLSNVGRRNNSNNKPCRAAATHILCRYLEIWSSIRIWYPCNLW